MMQFSTNHISVRASMDLIEICKPLMDACSITFFEYTRNYYDQTHIYLSTHPEAAEFMFQENQQSNIICFKHPAKYEFDYSLWDTADARYASYELAELIKNKFDIAHILNYVVRHKDYTEVFSFAGSLANTELNSIYLSQQHIFKHFAWYFRDKAELLLQAAEREKLYIPYANTFIDIADDVLLANNQQRLNNFLKQAQIKKYHFADKWTGIYLTAREIDCIEPLLAGHSYKQIAKILDLSPRTIEDRVKQLCIKLGCGKKIELLKILDKIYPRLIGCVR